MIPAAVYARYSSDLQADRSIEDQVALAQSWAARNGYAITRAYEDRAMSGTRFLDRLGLQRLLRDAKAGLFQAVIVEHADRLSRHPGDIHDIREALAFAGVSIQQVSGGELDAMKASVSGLVSSIMLTGLVDKIRRGMAGRVRDGLHAGGRAYGYRPVPGQPGKLEIISDEAEVIRRIFSAYVAGATARDIAAGLNRDGITPPRGGRWNASTITGWGKRGNGIIGNELYAGTIVWNKVSMVRNPETRRRVSRANPPSLWQRTEAPALAIVDRPAWEAAQGRRRGPRLTFTRTPRHPLSGLLRCPCCGGGMSVKDRSAGRIRIRCTRFAESGDCSNRATYYLDRIESAVFGGLAAQMDNAEGLAAYVEAYNAEWRRLDRDQAGARDAAARRLTQVEADLDRAVGLLIAGTVSDETMAPRIAALEAQKRALQAEIDAAPQPATARLNTGAVARFRAAMADLRGAIGLLPDHAAEHIGALRHLVSRVIVGTDYKLQVFGDLAPLVGGNGGSGGGS